VCTGSRVWEDRDAIAAAMRETSPAVVIAGDCPRGADPMFADIARHSAECELIVKRADWSKGRGAGMKRNAEMIAEAERIEVERGMYAMVLAAWDGKREHSGTLDCLRRGAQVGWTWRCLSGPGVKPMDMAWLGRHLRGKRQQQPTLWPTR